MIWNLPDARNRLSELMDLALSEGPQTITLDNAAVVILSAETYAELTGRRQSFKDYLLQGTGLDELDLTRDQTPGRYIEL